MAINSKQDFDRISSAIDFIFKHRHDYPSLEDIASSVHLSTFHFQRMFTKWSGVSPKQFQRFISLEYAKSLIDTGAPTLFEVAEKVGLSGTGRLHDLFIHIEGMTPGEYKNGGEGLVIHYHHYGSPFGEILVGSTPKGICWLSFDDTGNQLEKLHSNYPKALFENKIQPIHQAAVAFLNHDNSDDLKIRLHLKGTNFQLKVWNALLAIPESRVATYKTVGDKIGQPNSARAIGSAIGRNPVAFLIPCHRVIRATGALSGYMWGERRKRALIGWEGAQATV